MGTMSQVTIMSTTLVFSFVNLPINFVCLFSEINFVRRNKEAVREAVKTVGESLLVSLLRFGPLSS